MKKNKLHSIFHIFIVALLIMGFQTSVLAQVSKKAQKYFDEADYDIGLNKFESAKEKLLLAIKASPDFDKAHLYLANVNFQLEDFEGAIAEYNYILQTKEYPFVVNLYLARAYFSTQQFDSALKYVDLYLSNDRLSPTSKTTGEKLRRNAAFSKEAFQHPVDFEPINLGEAVNSSDSEYMPYLSADEETVIYTRLIHNQEDLYITGKKNDEWIKAEPMEEDVITTGHNEGAHCISADGKLLLYTICNEKHTLGSCDIYMSKKTKDGWSLPTNIGKPINSFSWDSQPSLSADGKSIYFVSNRAGGYGGKDIWVSHYDHKWSEPVNLGPEINTEYDEQSPFIHFDNETLYFSSDGHPGLGKQDIYFSKQKAGKFTTPVNLGWPINTHKNESGLNISLDGNVAYYAAEKEEGFGGLDIYEFKTPDFAKPKRVTYVKGNIFDQTTHKAIDAEFILSDLEGNITPITQITENGSFLICLPSGKDYSLHVKKDGYLFESYHFQLKDTVERKAHVLEIRLEPMEKGKSIVLNNVFFETNSYALLPESKIELDELYDLLILHPTVKIEISGHTDDIGPPTYNLELSQKRAQSVVNYLVKKGITIDRLTARGYADFKPIAGNDTPEGRAKNRRTEFTVISE
ncbi:MAG: OmpA family protein [Bacteroidetes bacterium]|nr:OmpA family protein [Bacteroidota bacterium]